jgi:hypothetical protein
MRDIKPTLAHPGQIGEAASNDLFAYIVSQVQKLPSERRGVEALRLTSRLLEFATFELAGTLGSEKAGAMIECAAQLSKQSDISESPMPSTDREPRRAIH